VSRSHRRRVEDAYVSGETGNHELFVQGCDDARRHGFPGVDQHFEPFAEPIRVELFVSPWPGMAPQVEVEDRCQLRGCCRSDELSTGVESTAPNQLMQRLGRKVRHDLREVRRIEHAREGTWQRRQNAAAGTALVFRHELAMIRVSPLNKQS